MAVQIKQRMSLEEFEHFTNLPENYDQTFELIGGEMVEVPSNPFVSKIAGLILTALNLFLREHDLGHVTGEAGGYMIYGERFAPDVAYISYERQPELAQKGYNPKPPELAVEIISDPSNRDEQATLRRKVATYLMAGTHVWIVNPYDRYVEIYHPEKRNPVKIVDETGILDGAEILPGFKLPVKDFLPKSTQSN